MEHHGHLIKWIEQIGYMKIKFLIVIFGLVCILASTANAQVSSKDYRKDSLQFKMYTRLYINEQLGVDSLTVKKIFCDFCSEKQMDVLQQEAMRQSMIERHNPRYRKPGEHRLALIVRFSKEDFRNLNNK